ncbi:MAG TPA: TrkH family potassium uptake protein [Alphaproteobacteria bacterium]|nr:TrkH family potassium uptake protein [Alphaproteobacteria bacterium]
MIDFRPIFFTIGILLTTLAFGMMIPAVADLIAGHSDWRVFAGAAGLNAFIGITMLLTMRADTGNISTRQAFLLTTLSWLVIGIFGALPFAFADLNLSFTDAVFESMSGITTTGATVLTNLDGAPPGILLWRALLQWFGGIGIIVMAVAILPQLSVGGMQLFRTESSDQSEKVLPRIAQVAAAIGILYVSLTAICASLYWLAGMSGFEAIAHSMTTIATGGFSTRDGSVGFFQNAGIDWIAVVFMILGSLPFVLYLRAVRGNVTPLIRDSQVQWFLIIAAASVALLVAWQVLINGVRLGEALRFVAFNAVSIMTGTGYSTSDFGLWGAFPVAMFFFLMFVGGCAGSTTCGLKIFRLQVLYAHTVSQISKLMQPHGVFIPHFNHRPIPAGASESVLSFFFLYIMAFGALAVGLGWMGLDFLTAVSGAASAIANVGPGLGPVIGPAGTYAPLPDAAKWLLSFGMLLGRLELFTVLVLLTPQFWRD